MDGVSRCVDAVSRYVSLCGVDVCGPEYEFAIGGDDSGRRAVDCLWEVRPALGYIDLADDEPIQR